jgi:DNA-binding transcriptional LysR family regulator
MVDLDRENYDFAIRITGAPIDGAASKQIGLIHHQLCASPNYLVTRGTPASAKDLSSHSLLHYGHPGGPNGG